MSDQPEISTPPKRPLQTVARVMAVPATAGSRSTSTCRARTNPEQLFALGYAASFQSSLLRFAFGRKLDLTDTRITARVGIGPVKGGGFGLTAALDLDAPQISRDEAFDLMARAHETCPYSRATRGNIDVTLTVGGATIERQAA
jgi:osmotically inducible protein OsmC